MEKQYSVADAKNSLTSIIHDVETGVPVKLTRHGKPVAILLSIREYDFLKKNKGSFWQLLMEFRNSMEKEGIDISDSDFAGLRDVTSGREVNI
ncbi:MAG: type II toxin-antitoxin system Phd/YefM family antitoxin [Desulfobacterales bacterium]|jgi:prevent-host-death family protein|nr:type II toxin-antitoxin system Phd/YefM family antitoxin [Desulfobacterales bacterium]